jgi:hypothetical protein
MNCPRLDSNFPPDAGVCYLIRLHNEAVASVKRFGVLPRYMNVAARARCWVREDHVLLTFRNIGIGPRRTVRFGESEQIDPNSKLDAILGGWSMKFNVGRDQWQLGIRRQDIEIFEQLSWFQNFPIPRLF